MIDKNGSPHKELAQITREQFLFYEMRIIAKLMYEKVEDNEIIDWIVGGEPFPLSDGEVHPVDGKSLCREIEGEDQH